MTAIGIVQNFSKSPLKRYIRGGRAENAGKSVAIGVARELQGESFRNETVEESGRCREQWRKKKQITGSFLKVPSSRRIL